MKNWSKTLFLVSLFLFALAFFVCLLPAPKECILCKSIRYHAPCLLDLQDGELVELDVYVPHDEMVAELANPQPHMDTFSFVCIGDIVGSKYTGEKKIALEIPTTDILEKVALCNECQNLLPKGYKNRYIIADLYDKDKVTLFSIENGNVVNLRCYKITMEANEQNKSIVVNLIGTLETS